MSRPSRWGRWVVLTVTAAALVAAGAGAVVLFRSPAIDPDTGEPRPSTVDIQRTTLIQAEDVPGILGYGEPQPLESRLQGTLTAVAPEGTIVHRGQELYSVDATPVLLLYGTLPAYRALATGTSGADVRQFEENLAALGYTGFTVDDEFSARTAEVVEAWQHDLGVEQTGSVELGLVFFAPDAVRVASTQLGPGNAVSTDAEVLGITGTSRLVTAQLDVDQRGLVSDGAPVTVTLPGDTTTTGTVARIGTVVEAGPDSSDEAGPAGGGGAGGQASFTVTIAVADPAAAPAFDQAPVTVHLTSERRDDVLAVPVDALLALREGGYGVELVDGTDSRTVPVRTGLFAGGLVEVSGPGIAEGVRVEVPQS